MAGENVIALNPGSDAALAYGCRCPVLDNCHGKGYQMQPGLFVISNKCTLHAAPRKWLRKKIADVQTEGNP